MAVPFCVAAGVLIPSPVSSEEERPKCYPREAFVKAAKSVADVNVVVLGIHRKGLVMEIFATEDGNWSLTVTNPKTGLLCLLSYGGGLKILGHGKDL